MSPQKLMLNQYLNSIPDSLSHTSVFRKFNVLLKSERTPPKAAKMLMVNYMEIRSPQATRKFWFFYVLQIVYIDFCIQYLHTKTMVH